MKLPCSGVARAREGSKANVSLLRKRARGLTPRRRKGARGIVNFEAIPFWGRESTRGVEG